MKSRRLQWLSMLLAFVIVAACVIPAAAPDTAHAAGTVYYVDSVDGDDADSGTSEDAAWKTLNKVNATTFQPGDTILFKAGGAWKGTLNPKGSGTEGSPIKIDRYGDGSKPLIAGNGAQAAVYFYSQEQWEVRNLEITNYAATAGVRRGIHVAGNSGGWNNPKVYRHFVFENLEIHSVKGSVATDYAHNGGIIVWDDSWNYVVTDVTIKNNKIYSLDSVGIYLNGGSKPYSFNNKVTDNVIYDIAADGAFVLNTNNGLIENNVVYDTHKRATGYHVPLWFFESKDSIIQYNEVFNTYPGGDAMAYDSDYKSEGTIIQYNYSHNNAGGMTLAVNDGSQAGTYNRNTIIRYNISQNDLGAVFNYSGTPENTHVYNNTVYIPASSNTKVVDTLNWGGWAKDTTYTNNIIVNLGSGGYNFGSSTGNVFDNNLFYGNHPSSVLALDANKIVADPMLAAPGTGRIGRNTLGGYQLLQGSPAIGTGKIIPNNGGKDYFGNPVPADSAPNIGAYEGPGLDPANLPPALAVTNLLANPGFEEGSFSGWGTTYGGAAIVDTGARTGTKAAQLANAVSGIEQTVTVKPNTVYKLSGFAKSTSGGSAVLGVKNYGNAAKDTPMGGTAYTGKEVAFTAGNTNTTAVIYMYKQSGTGTVTFDDLVLFEYGQVQPAAVPPALAPEPLPGLQNLARTATLSTSSNNASFPKEKAADGVKDSPDSRWITAAGTAPPHWFQMDWSQNYTVDRVRVWSGAGPGATNWQIRDFQVQVWDGSAWQTVAQVTDNPKDGRIGEYNDLVFAPVSTNKMRIYITKGTYSGTTNDNVARVFEIEAWEHDPNPTVPEVDPIYVFAVDVAGQNRVSVIDAGTTLQMAATVKPANADVKTLTWSVLGEDGQPTGLATIDQTGLLTAVGVGKVKVVAATQDGSGVAGVAWVTLTQPPVKPNIAPLAAVTASSSHETGNYPPTLAVNGNRYGNPDRWITANTESTHWLELDWDRAYAVDRVRVWSGQMDGRGMNLADFEIQYWNGADWQTAASVAGSTMDNYLGQFNDLTFAPITTDRLRLYITKGNPVFDNRARVFEMEVYGSESTEEPPVLVAPSVQLTGPASVYAGVPVSTGISVTASTYEYSLLDMMVQYDPAVLEYTVTQDAYGTMSLGEGAITATRAGLQILGTGIKPDQGLIRIILGTGGAPVADAGELFRLNGKVKDQAAAGQTVMSVADFVIAGSNDLLLDVDTSGVQLAMTVAVADRTALGQAVTAAQGLHDGAVEGTATGQYPAGSKAVLQAAIQAAVTVYQQPGATQQQVNDALAALTLAVNTFTASVNPYIPVDKDELEEAIAAAQELFGKTVAGTKIGQYPAAAKAALQAAIEAADAVYDSASAGQSEVDDAVAALNDEAEEYLLQRITLVQGETEITIRTLSLVAKYFGTTSSDPEWSSIEAADILDQQEITIQSLAAVAQMIISDWYHQ